MLILKFNDPFIVLLTSLCCQLPNENLFVLYISISNIFLTYSLLIIFGNVQYYASAGNFFLILSRLFCKVSFPKKFPQQMYKI